MPYLTWISDENLIHEVSLLLKTARSAQNSAKKDFGKNVIDPFSALFEMSGFEMDYKSWLTSESARQAQKTLQNHVGEFHQNILGYSPGWINMKVGNVIDLVSNENKIIAEIKNKHNTVTGGKLSDLYSSLNNLVMPKASVYKGYTAYYVTIIPKRPERFNKCFTPSDKAQGAKCAENEAIRIIDGASFYSLATGVNNALEQLFEVLPEIINKCSSGSYTFNDKEKLKEFFKMAYG